jgi:hypothetical protein
MTGWKCALVFALACGASAADSPQRLKVHMTWGEDSVQAAPYYMKLIAASPGLTLENMTGISLEPGEAVREGAWQTHAGAGDVDGVEFTLLVSRPEPDTIQNVHIIWADLIAASDGDTARRLLRDGSMHPASPKLAIQMNPEGTRGFTVTADQLFTEKSMWIPSLHVYIAAGDHASSFAEHRAQLAPWNGRRVLDQIHTEPEATYKRFASLWEDMGNPSYVNPQSRGPGHIVCLTWDSAIPKFGVDRGAGVWNDYGNPDHFQFWFDFGDISKGITRTWKGQHLDRGLPVITTLFEQNGIRYEVEQFGYPLDGPPKERSGDLKMVMLQQVRATELEGKTRQVPVTFSHRRQLPSSASDEINVERSGDTAVFRDRTEGRVLLALTGLDGEFQWNRTSDYQREMKRVNGTVFLDLPAHGTRHFIVKLASPPIGSADASTFQQLDYVRARQETLRFWSDYVNRGARFSAPEKVVNDMFNASLWHALRLPRRHGGSGPNVTMDLPYSNFAYSQTGTPWPVNQAVYVDYMLYDLRGYHGIAAEELAAQYRNNQEDSGHVKGAANWTVYTPGMLYAVAQNYLLSHDRAALDHLMPGSMKAVEWCLQQLRAAETKSGHTSGLVTGPLNDLTGEGVWAFNQAYMSAGLELFGRVLEEIGNPRATECKVAARRVREAIERGFGAASARSPLVQLRDHTWEPYVPCEANTPRRILEQWYPTDVDTGAVHMIRLKAIVAHSGLSDWLLNDHEDNLFYKGLGIANEPVYNQQGTAYLLRDDPEAAIRTFYSYMASGFSHTVYEPVEHRWTHGQYFGPPSTDGAWFELYRNMLLHERDDGALVLGLATPRPWLADGKKIQIQNAPSYYGKLSMIIDSSARSGRITASVTMPDRHNPRELLVRLRHPERRRISRVTVNGRNWTDFDPNKEWVRIAEPKEARYTVVALY